MDVQWPDGVGRAVFTGRVFSGGRPAGGATVRVRPAAPGPVTAPPGDAVVLPGGFDAVTGSDGVFSLDVPAGVPLVVTVWDNNKVAARAVFSAAAGQTVRLADVVAGVRVVGAAPPSTSPQPGGSGDGSAAAILSGDGPPGDDVTAPPGSLYVDMLTGDVYELV